MSKRNPTESISVTSTGSDAFEESSHQPPPGSIPTPVIIASKIAEHQGTGGTSSLPSVLVQRGRNLESPNSPPSRRGPPTHAKPHRLPDNINMMLGSREPSPQSIATAAVNMQERRSQMLANLPPSAHPLEGGEPACVSKPPLRSVSFRDPALDKSRMEALSMLGLTQAKTMPANMVPVSGIKTQSSPISRSRLATMPPAPAPRPQRPTGSLRPRPDPIPQEIRSKPASKPSFRAQGITVQFSGKGATDEARRDALRKLGLLKNTS
uniref:Proline and serine rich 2 n=1 Tax=Pygocentrus nattereri TaxID=42514 RepID=A0AAR2IN62_PYGNA